MKILITTDVYKPLINGVVTSVCNLKKGLEDDGHEVRILTLSRDTHSVITGDVYAMGSMAAGVIYPDIRILPFPDAHILKALTDWRPDVIHSQCEFSTFHAARILAKRTGAPIVHTYHTLYEDYTHYFSPSRTIGRQAVSLFSRSIAEHTEAMIAPTDKVKNLLTGYHIETPTIVIPTGIDLCSFDTEKEEKRKEVRLCYGIRPEECVLLFLGRIAKEKNIEELIDNFSNVTDPRVRLLIAGGGPEEAVLKQYAADLHLGDRVIFTGMIEPDRVAEIYRAGDIFVSASKSETQGLTTIEAMAAGLPLLCREDPALESILTPGINGYTYTDAEEFSRQLTTLVQKKLLRDRMGEASARMAQERFSIAAFAHACEGVYEACIS